MNSSSFHPVRRSYAPAPVCYGGGFVFPELNDGMPWRTPEEWAALLDENDVQCEWPGCDALAVTMMVVEKATPFLCEMHKMVCTSSARARAILKDHFVDMVLILSYGKPKSRGKVIPSELSVPYVRRLTLPKLGQNTA